MFAVNLINKSSVKLAKCHNKSSLPHCGYKPSWMVHLPNLHPSWDLKSTDLHAWRHGVVYPDGPVFIICIQLRWVWSCRRGPILWRQSSCRLLSSSLRDILTAYSQWRKRREQDEPQRRGKLLYQHLCDLDQLDFCLKYTWCDTGFFKCNKKTVFPDVYIERVK